MCRWPLSVKGPVKSGSKLTVLKVDGILNLNWAFLGRTGRPVQTPLTVHFDSTPSILWTVRVGENEMEAKNILENTFIKHQVYLQV